MADQYRGTGALPSVTDAPPAVYTPQEARQADRQARGEELNARAFQSSADVLAAADKAAALASVQARIQAAKDADAKRRGDPTYGAQEMQSAGEAQFGQAFEALGAPGRAQTSPRPFYRETKQYNDTMRGTLQQPGLVDEVVPLAGQVQQAELEQQEIAASSMEEMADRQLQAMTQLRANQQAAADRGRAQLDRQQRMNDLALKAADDLASSADVDPGKGWADAPLWSKFTAVLAAGLLGWAGASDPTSHIRAVADQSIRAQEAALAKKQQRVGNLTNQASLEQSLYEKIQAESASKLEGDLVYTKAILMHAQQQAMARLQRAGVKVLNGQQQQFMNGLQQEVAGIDLQLNKQAAANTPTITTMRPAYNSDQRSLLKEAGKQGLKDASSGSAAVVDSAQKREDMSGKARIEADKAAREGGDKLLRGEGGILKELASFDSRVGPQQGVVTLIEDMEKQYAGKDIPGISPGALGEGAGGWDAAGRYAMPGASESAKVDSQIKAIKEALGRAQSQGAITPEELDNFSNYIESGLFLGGDARFRQNLGEVKEMLNARIQSAERVLSQEAREYYHRNKDIGDLGARAGSGAVGTEDPVVQE